MSNTNQDFLKFLAKSDTTIPVNEFFKDQELSSQQIMLMLEDLKHKGLINVTRNAFSLGNSVGGVVSTISNTIVKASITEAGKKSIIKVSVSVKSEKTEEIVAKPKEVEVKKEKAVEKTTENKTKKK